MNKQRLFYEARAKEMVLALQQAHEVSYTDLAERLRAHGVALSRRALTNKLHRGTFSFAFALQVLAALGETSIPVPQLPAELWHTHRPKPPPQPED